MSKFKDSRVIDAKNLIFEKLFTCFPGKVSAPWICPRFPALALVRHLTSRPALISRRVSGLRAHCLSDTRPQHKQWVFRVSSPWPRVSRVSPRAQLPTGRRRSRNGPRSISNTGFFHLRQPTKGECPPMCRWSLHCLKDWVNWFSWQNVLKSNQNQETGRVPHYMYCY